MSDRRLYHTWWDMKDRCYNGANKHYKDYGGRGITVCERWVNSFKNFVTDIGDKPKGMSIERINNDKGYTPLNCKWATSTQQATNRRPKPQGTHCSFGHEYSVTTRREWPFTRHYCQPCAAKRKRKYHETT